MVSGEPGLETQTRCSSEASSRLSAEAEEAAGPGRGQMPPLLRASVSPSVKQGAHAPCPASLLGVARLRGHRPQAAFLSGLQTQEWPSSGGGWGCRTLRGQSGADARCWEQSVLGRSRGQGRGRAADRGGGGGSCGSRGELRPGRVTVLLMAPFAFKEIKLFLVPEPLPRSQGGSLSGRDFLEAAKCGPHLHPGASPNGGAGSGQTGVRGSPGPGCAGGPGLRRAVILCARCL